VPTFLLLLLLLLTTLRFFPFLALFLEWVLHHDFVVASTSAPALFDSSMIGSEDGLLEGFGALKGLGVAVLIRK